MKDKYKWSPGTYRTIPNKSNPYAAGRTEYDTTVDAVLTSINTTPDSGVNLGNKVDPTSWEYSVITAQKFTGTIIQYYPTGVEYDRRVGVYGGEPLSGPPWERTSLYNRALERLNSKVRDQADWAEDIAQAKSTSKALGLAKLGSLARDAVDITRRLKKDPLSFIPDRIPLTRRKGFEKAIKEGVDTVSSGILAYKYVYKPLVMNVYDTAATLLNTNDGGLMHIRAGATLPIDWSGVTQNSASGTNQNNVKFNCTGKQGCRLHVVMRGLDENRLADFSTLDPRVLAWNLLPYSFVVDWFYSVGGYLEAQEHALRFNPLFVRGYIDELYACYRTEDVTGASNYPGGGVSFHVPYARARRREIRFKRSVLGGWPLPRRPVFTTDLGSSRLLAAAALLGTILGRK